MYDESTTEYDLLFLLMEIGGLEVVRSESLDVLYEVVLGGI